MTTRNLAGHYQVFKRYFENAKEDASLFDFASSHKSFIVENHVLGEDIPTIWTKRFKTSYSQFCEEKGIEKNPAVYTGTSPNWGSIALQVARTPAPVLESPTSASTTTNTTATSTSSSGTSTTVPMVTPEFLAQFQATHKEMSEADKWKLPSGVFVEDLILNHGLSLLHEHACHSFIVDLDDPMWLTLVPDASDRKALLEHSKQPLPIADSAITEYLESFVGKSAFHDLMQHARSKLFDVETEFELDWIQSTIETALRLFPAKYFPLTDQTESDILKRLWIFIDKAFDNLEVDVRSGEMESTSSSDRRNITREPKERKRHGHRADLLMKTESGEFGCCEAGKADHGDQGTKEIAEGGLKAPKMMKDMLWSLSKTFPNAENLEVVGFIISGLKAFTLIMDRPSTYVCRITRTRPMHFPTAEEHFAVKMGSLIKLVLQAKQVVVRTLKAIEPKTIEDPSVQSTLLGVRQLPPCATSPKPAKRQRVSPHSVPS